MFNSHLIEIAIELNNGHYEQTNPIVQAVREMYLDIVSSEIEMWLDYDPSDKGFAENFMYDFPPGFIRRDMARAKQILYDLQDIARGAEIRYELSPIYTYVMYHLIDHRNYYLEDEDYDPEEIPCEVIKYLQEKNIHPDSDIYWYIQSWFTKRNSMNDDFEYVYNEDYVSAEFAENIANIYLEDDSCEVKLAVIGVSIDEFFDLLPNDLLERVKKKYQKGTETARTIFSAEGEKLMDVPTVFISYSWEDDEHRQWVRSLADSLLKNGINAVIDQYDLSLGDRLPHFMEQSIAESDYVLIICTPTYKTKSDNRNGGVGYEGHIISGELLTTGNERKFIPVLRKGTIQTSIPNCLSGKLAVDLSNGQHYSVNFNDLITTLQGQRKKPPIISSPHREKDKSAEKQEHLTEPIQIMGIITDQVTVPKMDGSRGSALYKIPFKLSKKPSELWKDLFIRAWNNPPEFSSMHRPGIASVYGEQIILDGTTIEEVRDYHRKTLALCVKKANDEEARVIYEEQRKKEREEALKNEHYSNVGKIAENIIF